jgi:hypothetical protein
MQKISRAKQAFGQGGMQQLLDFIDTPLTLAQILALNATPITVVPTPGPGWSAVLDSVVVQYTYGSAAFTIGTCAGLGFKYTNGSGLQVAQCAVTSFIDQASNQLRHVNAYRAASGASDFTPVPNAVIVIQALTAAPTVGTACTMKVRCYYRRVPAAI